MPCGSKIPHHHLQLVRYKEYGFALSSTPNGFAEDMGAHAGIDGTERVVQEKNGPLTVDCTRQAHSLTLASTQVGSPLANLKRENRNKFFTELSSCWGWINFIAETETAVYDIWEINVFRADILLKKDTDTSVMSPYGSAAMSGRRQHASSTAWYLIWKQICKIRDNFPHLGLLPL